MSKWIILVLGAFLAGINTSAWALTADEIMQRVNDREAQPVTRAAPSWVLISIIQI